jgi:chaperonin GroES
MSEELIRVNGEHTAAALEYSSGTDARRLFFADLEKTIDELKQRKLESGRRLAQAVMPLYDQVLIFPVGDESVTDSGAILIPEVARQRPSEGIVIATGPGRVHPVSGAVVPMTVRRGDRVLYGKYAGTEYKLRGQTLRLVDEGEVLAVIA